MFSRCHTLYFKGTGKTELTLNPLLANFLTSRKALSYTELVKLAKQIAKEVEEEIHRRRVLMN